MLKILTGPGARGGLWKLTRSLLLFIGKDLRFRSWMLDEAILRGIEFTSVPTQMDMVIEALKGKDKKARQEQLRLLEQAYHGFANSNYSADVDKKIAKVMLKGTAAKSIRKRNRPISN